MRLTLLSFVLVASLVASAQQGMTLQECIDYAVANNEQLAIAAMESDIADTQVKEQLSGGLPQVTGDIEITKNIEIQTSFIQDFVSPAVYDVLKDENLLAQNAPVPEPQTFPASFGTNYSGRAGIGISQLIFNGSFFVGLRAARTVNKLSEKKQRQTEVEIVQSVSNAFYLVLISQENLNFLATNFSSIDTLLYETSEMFENGFAEKIDVSRIKIQHNNLKTTLRNSTELLITAISLLKFQMGMPLQEQLVLNGNLNDFELDTDLVGDENAFMNRPEYSVLQTNKELIELNMQNFKSQYLPSIYANYNLGWTAGTSSFGDLTRFNDKTWFKYSNIGVSMSIPIFDGFYKKSRVQRTRVELLQTQSGIDQLKNNISREIEEARTKLANASRDVSAQEENVELAQEVYNTTKIKYQEGVGTNLEVIDANTSLKEAKTNYLNAVYDEITSQIQLKKSLGTLYKN